MFKTAQKTARLLILLSTLLFTGFFCGMVYFIFGLHREVPVPFKVAFWMEHDFSTGVKSVATELTTTLSEFEQSPFSPDLFIHAGPLNSDGSLPGDLKVPQNLGDLHEGTIYAWLGQIRSKIDLENPTVRAGIVDSAGVLLKEGFEGIHLDIEPIPRDDTAFITLLQELRLRYPDTLISVAMDEWQPHGLSQWVANLYGVAIESYWSTEQVESVLPYIDQLVVMTYDTGFNDERVYEWWVEQQSIALSQIMEGTEVELLLGIPTYSQGVRFNPDAENISSGLTGYLRGVTNVRSVTEVIGGVAIYPYWETSDEEWKILKNMIHEIDFQK